MVVILNFTESSKLRASDLVQDELERHIIFLIYFDLFPLLPLVHLPSLSFGEPARTCPAKLSHTLPCPALATSGPHLP